MDRPRDDESPKRPPAGARLVVDFRTGRIVGPADRPADRPAAAPQDRREPAPSESARAA